MIDRLCSEGGGSDTLERFRARYRVAQTAMLPNRFNGSGVGAACAVVAACAAGPATLDVTLPDGQLVARAHRSQSESCQP